MEREEQLLALIEASREQNADKFMRRKEHQEKLDSYKHGKAPVDKYDSKKTLASNYICAKAPVDS